MLGIKIDIAPEVRLVIPEDQRIDVLNKHIISFGEAKSKVQQLPSGHTESHHVSEHVFREQFYNYKKFQTVQDPSSNGNVYIEKIQHGDHPLDFDLKKRGIDDVIAERKSVFSHPNLEENKKRKEIKSLRQASGDPASGDFLGPWAPYQAELDYNKEYELTEEQKATLKEIEEKRKVEIEKGEEVDDFQSKFTFYGEKQYDYQGRSFVIPPPSLTLKDDTSCYLPTKVSKIYAGHTKGVLKATFFPGYGHFILSSSYDTTIRLWDVYKSKELTMLYQGHKKAVKDLCFTNDGLHFLSTGFDNRLNYWDTETGQVVRSYKHGCTPFCGQFNPDVDRNHSFLVGDIEKTITQFDVRAEEPNTKYTEHLGPVNTVTFVDNNRKFASTSDDKKVFLWEFGVPIVVKHISDPEMNAISATDIHPNDKYFLGQSSNNRILCFDVKAQSIRLNKKKKFMGHNSGGY